MPYIYGRRIPPYPSSIPQCVPSTVMSPGVAEEEDKVFVLLLGRRTAHPPQGV